MVCLLGEATTEREPGENCAAQREASKILLVKSATKPIILRVMIPSEFTEKFKAADARTKSLVVALGFSAKPLSIMALPTATGDIAEYWVGAPQTGADPFSLGGLASKLPEGTYALEGEVGNAHLAALGWCLELYKYDPFRKIETRQVKLVCPVGVNRETTVFVRKLDRLVW